MITGWIQATSRRRSATHAPIWRWTYWQTLCLKEVAKNDGKSAVRAPIWHIHVDRNQRGGANILDLRAANRLHQGGQPGDGSGVRCHGRVQQLQVDFT